MADIITNEAQLRIASGLMVWPTNSVVACLYNSSASFSATSSSYSSTNELATSGGYTQLNKSISGKTITLDAVNNQVMYDCDNITWTASGGSLGPARYCAFVDTQGGANKYLYIMDFSTNKTADDTTDFRITVDVSGLFRTRVA
jgi:hypothetical protein